MRLDVPFERAIAISLLQIVASHRTYIFRSVTWEKGGTDKKPGAKGRGEKKIKLVQAVAHDIEDYFDAHQKEVVRGLRLLQEAAANMDLGARLFKEADKGGWV